MADDVPQYAVAFALTRPARDGSIDICAVSSVVTAAVSLDEARGSAVERVLIDYKGWHICCIAVSEILPVTAFASVEPGSGEREGAPS